VPLSSQAVNATAAIPSDAAMALLAARLSVALFLTIFFSIFMAELLLSG
jgi:hypothetical protein